MMADLFGATVEQSGRSFQPAAPGAAEVAAVLGLPQQTLDTGMGHIEAVSIARAKLMAPVLNTTVLDVIAPDL
jgi:hypothetical protein